MPRRAKAALPVRLAGAAFFLVLALSFLFTGSLSDHTPFGWFLAVSFYFIGACCLGLTVQALFDL